jgi:hypothetical protein
MTIPIHVVLLITIQYTKQRLRSSINLQVIRIWKLPIKNGPCEEKISPNDPGCWRQLISADYLTLDPTALPPE